MSAPTQDNEFSIAGHRVGLNQPCFVIAEVAQAHDGSLGTAHAYIDAVAQTGAQAIKFQTHYADEESTPAEPWRIKFSRQDDSRFDYWKRMEFDESAWRGLAKHAQDAGLVFLSSAFSQKAVDLLTELDMPAWKVASGEVANHELLESMAKTGKPVLLSTGMSAWEEIDVAAKLVRKHAPVGIFQTTTAYPCPPESIGLNVIGEIAERYGCPVGLSDHSSKPYAGIAARALGASMLEVHVVLSRASFGPDTSSSLTPEELTTMVDGVRFVETALQSPVNKDAMAKELSPLRQIFKKSVVIKAPLPEGTELRREHLAAKKPGTGICASEMGSVLGRTLKHSVDTNHILKRDDLV